MCAQERPLGVIFKYVATTDDCNNARTGLYRVLGGTPHHPTGDYTTYMASFVMEDNSRARGFQISYNLTTHKYHRRGVVDDTWDSWTEF